MNRSGNRMTVQRRLVLDKRNGLIQLRPVREVVLFFAALPVLPWPEKEGSG